jgi:hypothetical protein
MGRGKAHTPQSYGRKRRTHFRAQRTRCHAKALERCANIHMKANAQLKDELADWNNHGTLPSFLHRSRQASARYRAKKTGLPPLIDYDNAPMPARTTKRRRKRGRRLRRRGLGALRLGAML